jgi:hypothetical protein
VCLWMPMVAWGVVKLVRVLIDWRGRAGYERVRATLIADALRAVSPGVTVSERRADGTMLRIEARAHQEGPMGAGETARGKLC